MSDKFRFDVFLSYSAPDRPVVRRIADRLVEAGLRVWYDEWEIRPGDSIPAMIEKGLESSRVLALCTSHHSQDSHWARLESDTFRFRDPLNETRRFVPLRLDAAPLRGSIAQFLAIEWDDANSAECLGQLLAACTTPPAGASSAANQREPEVEQVPEDAFAFGDDSFREYPLEVQGLLRRARGSEAAGEVWEAARRFAKAAEMLRVSGLGSEPQIEALVAQRSVNEALGEQLRIRYRGQPGPTLVKVFDEANTFQRTATKLEVHREGLLHHSALLVARAANGEVVYYQRRPEQTYPGAYDFLGGHTADIDDSPLETARREANEELNLLLNGTRLLIPDAWIHQIGPDHRFECFSPQDRERSTLFVVTLPQHPALTIYLTDEAADGIQLLNVKTFCTAKFPDLVEEFLRGKKEFASGAERVFIAYEQDPAIREEIDRWFA